MVRDYKSDMIYTAESVTAWHPDKICDQISDAIVDECLKQDEFSRVAVETTGGHNTIVLIGEITTKADVDFVDVARRTYRDLTGKDIGVFSNIVKQSREIAQGVNTGGAGDQGIMVGYACNDNPMFIPQELFIARKLLEEFKVDGKSQVTLDDNKASDIVISIQGKTSEELVKYVKNYAKKHKGWFHEGSAIYANNTGSFMIGGFDSDSGCTGRKIVVDAYGPRVPVGGGSFSGKDPTKVDRSGAYMARWMALSLLKKAGAKEVTVKLAYVIGGEEPVMITACIDGRTHNISGGSYDCRPIAIIERFKLRRPIYLETARYGHFGFKHYPWEQV